MPASPAGDEQVGHGSPVGGPPGDRARGPVLEVVGVGDDGEGARPVVREGGVRGGHARILAAHRAVARTARPSHASGGVRGSDSGCDVPKAGRSRAGRTGHGDQPKRSGSGPSAAVDVQAADRRDVVVGAARSRRRRCSPASARGASTSGMTTLPSCTCQRSTTWAGVLPCLLGQLAERAGRPAGPGPAPSGLHASVAMPCSAW